MAGHQANLYSDKPDGQSVDRSVRFYLEAGVHPTKLVVGTSDLYSTGYEIKRDEQVCPSMDVLSLTPKELVSLSQVQAKGHGRQECGTTKLCLSLVPKKPMTIVSVLHTAMIRKILGSFYLDNATDYCFKGKASPHYL